MIPRFDRPEDFPGQQRVAWRREPQRTVLAALAREVMGVAAAGSYPLNPMTRTCAAAFGRKGTPAEIDASFGAMAAFNRRSAKTHTGVWRDIVKGHPLPLPL